jgi:threonine dehydrogenase-like Zn-dependent dehydrogenase
VLGHECVGRVVEVGADVHEPVPGTAFAVNPNHPYDEHDKLGHNLPGVFRQYAVWDGHLAGRGQLVALPEATSAAWVLLEPLACTVRSLRLAGDEPQWKDRRVLVVGAGISGLLHVLLARRWGADRVLLANRGAGRLDAAVARGVVARPDCLRVGRELAADVAAATGGAGVDAVILTTAGGTGPSTLDTLWPALADGATVHLFGGFLPDAVVRAPDGRVLPSQPIRSRGVRAPVGLPGGRTVTLVGSRGADRHDFDAALRACLPDPAATLRSDPPLDLAPLISHVVSLDAAPRVLDELAATGRVDGVAALRVVIDLTLDGDVVRRTDGTDLPTLDGVR